MIDQAVFKNAWALLCERFNRETSVPLMKAYYDALSARMDTEQFRAAAQRVFETCTFFPRPADFFEGGRDTQAEALAQWEAVQELMRGFGTHGLNDEGRRVVRLLGGESKLRTTPLDQVQFVRRDFLQLYGEAAAVAQREAGERIAPTREALRIARAKDEGGKGLMPLRVEIGGQQ